MPKKKTALGMDGKPRTQAEIDQEYTQMAAQLGHKYRIAAQIQENIAKIQGEMDQHLARMLFLNHESAMIPKSTPTEAPSV